MPVTAVKTKSKDREELRLQFMTIQHEDGLAIDIYKCDNEWIPIGAPDKIFQEDVDEEKYHKALRDTSDQHGEFQKAYSSNPEWNPGYDAAAEAEGNDDGPVQQCNNGN